jgi:hypothetical protein
MRRTGIFALIVGLVSLFCRQLQAESALVVLVRPPTQSALVREAITRIRGELVADGFEVAVVDAPPFADAALVLARADQQTSAAATLGLFVHADGKAAELWVIDRLTNKTVVRSIEMPDSQAGSAPEVLARRAVELLRASLLEILVDTREKPAASDGPRAKASRWVTRALEPRQSRWGVEAGAQLLTGFGQVGAAVMPVGRVRVALGRQLVARLTLSGLGTRPRVESGESSATVSQELGLLELIGQTVLQVGLKPSLSLGAGAYHIGVDGSAPSPYAGLAGDRFVFAADTGAGLALSISPSFALALEGHAIVLVPYPVIRFLQTETAEIGNPLLCAALTLVGRL